VTTVDGPRGRHRRHRRRDSPSRPEPHALPSVDAVAAETVTYEDRLALCRILDAVAVVDGGHLPVVVEVESEIFDRVVHCPDGRAVIGWLAEVGVAVVRRD
jgi:hypothetical protein